MSEITAPQSYESYQQANSEKYRGCLEEFLQLKVGGEMKIEIGFLHPSQKPPDKTEAIVPIDSRRIEVFENTVAGKRRITLQGGNHRFWNAVRTGFYDTQVTVVKVPNPYIEY